MSWSRETDKHVGDWLTNIDPKAFGKSNTVPSFYQGVVSRLQWDGNTIWSYGRHFILARKFKYEGAWFCFTNPDVGRSKTTNTHIDAVRTKALARGFVLGYLPETPEYDTIPTDVFEISAGSLSMTLQRGATFRRDLAVQVTEARAEEKKENAAHYRKQARKRKHAETLRDLPYVRNTLEWIRNQPSVSSVLMLLTAEDAKGFGETLQILDYLTAKVNQQVIAENHARVANYGVLGAGRNIAIEKANHEIACKP